MITIIKQDARGKEVWRYPGEVLDRTAEKILVSARFTRDDFEFNGVPLKKVISFWKRITEKNGITSLKYMIGTMAG